MAQDHLQICAVTQRWTPAIARWVLKPRAAWWVQYFFERSVPVLYKFLQEFMWEHTNEILSNPLECVAVPEALASQVIAMKMIGVNLFALQPSFLEYATKQTKRCLDLPRANQSIWQLVCILPFLYQFADNPRAVASSTLEMRYEYIWTPKDYVVFASPFPNYFSNSAKDEAPVLRRLKGGLKKQDNITHTHRSCKDAKFTNISSHNFTTLQPLRNRFDIARKRIRPLSALAFDSMRCSASVAVASKVRMCLQSRSCSSGQLDELAMLGFDWWDDACISLQQFRTNYETCQCLLCPD